MARDAVDIKGKVFGKLTAVNRGDDFVSPLGYTKSQWWCICDCGKTTLVRTDSLVGGLTKSCGCLVKKSAKLRELRKKDIRDVLSPEEVKVMDQLDLEFKLYFGDKS